MNLILTRNGTKTSPLYLGIVQNYNLRLMPGFLTQSHKLVSVDETHELAIFFQPVSSCCQHGAARSSVTVRCRAADPPGVCVHPDQLSVGPEWLVAVE